MKKLVLKYDKVKKVINQQNIVSYKYNDWLLWIFMTNGSSEAFRMSEKWFEFFDERMFNKNIILEIESSKIANEFGICDSCIAY